MQSLKPAYTQTWQNRHRQIGRSGFFSEMSRRGGGPAFNLSNIKVHIDTLYIHGHFASLENYALFGHWLDRVQTPVRVYIKILKILFSRYVPSQQAFDNTQQMGTTNERSLFLGVFVLF